MDYNNNHDSYCLSYENGINNTLNLIKNKEIINTDFNMNEKLKIGGLNHNLIKREGHFRLFLNENQRDYVNPNFDYKLLSDI